MIQEEERKDEVALKAIYNEKDGKGSKEIPVLVLIVDDGFRVVPAEDRTNKAAQMLDLLWNNAGQIDLDATEREV